jgi:uncharacterized protein YqgV (UPF0045/DUF77 family)
MWSEVGERSLFGLDMIKEAEEHIAKVRENLKAAQCKVGKSAMQTLIEDHWNFSQEIMHT